MNFNKYNLQKKIILVMSIASLLVVGIFTLIFTKLYNNYEEEVYGRESINTLHSLDSSIQGVIRSADNYSKLLISDATVQKQMSTGNLNEDTKGQQSVINTVYSILQFSDTMDSIWFIDNSGQKLTVGGYTTRSTEVDDSNYDELRTPYATAKILLETQKGHTYLSLVRSYNSTTDFSSVGIIGVDISEKYINSVVSDVIDFNTDKIFIIDENNEIVFCNDYEETERYLSDTTRQSLDSDCFYETKIGNQKMLFTGIKCKDRDWKILRFTPLPLKKNYNILLNVNIIMLVILGILILICSSFVAKLFTKPIEQMLEAMKGADGGNISRLNNIPALEEFKDLFSGYNKMVEHIHALIQETIVRQEQIRQVELNEIQEQMKPHFLYNTLDSIKALSMKGDTDKIGKLIDALGGFYRKSVSGGRQYFSIEEEIQMAEDYVKIMEIRFGEAYKCDIQCDNDCKKYLIPKLTIQPLVENAFQYGIKSRQHCGNIKVCIFKKEEQLHIIVNSIAKDIPDEIESSIMNSTKDEPGRMGINSIIQRLSLMYGDDFSYKIDKDSPSMIQIYLSVDALKSENE